MPSKSENQRRFMYSVLGYKTGKSTNVSDKVKKAAKSMSISQIQDFLDEHAMDDSTVPTLKSLVPEEMLVPRESPVIYKLAYGDNGLNLEKGIELAKSLMSKFQGVSADAKNDLVMIMASPDRSNNVQSYLKQTGYKIAKPTLADDVQQEDIENTNMISPLVKFNTKDVDLEKGKFTGNKWQKDNRL